MVYLIGYDLTRKAEKNYEELFKAILSFGTYIHLLDSTWLIQTQLSTSQVKDFLLPHIHKDDNLLVIRVYGDYGGWLPEDSWKWIQSVSY